MNLSPRAAFLIAIAAELVYIAGRTAIRAHFTAEVPRELVVTAWRIAFIVFYVALYREALKVSWRAKPARPLHGLLIAVIVLDLSVILLAGYAQQLELGLRLLYIATIPAVAIREELFYRFILQDQLEQRTKRSLVAIVLSSLLFVLFHVGAQPMNLFSVASMLAAALILGVTYQRTRSLLLVITLHALMDLTFMVSMKVLHPAWLLPGYFLVIFGALLAWDLDRKRERMGL